MNVRPKTQPLHWCCKLYGDFLTKFEQTSTTEQMASATSFLRLSPIARCASECMPGGYEEGDCVRVVFLPPRGPEHALNRLDIRDAGDGAGGAACRSANVSIGEEYAGRVSVGDVGVVVQTYAWSFASGNLSAKGVMVKVKFPGDAIMNFPATNRIIEHMPLAGGFQKGDRVALVDSEGVAGDEGVVVGPCDDASSVCVDWGPGKSTAPACTTGLRHAVLPGGFTKGDRVRALSRPSQKTSELAGLSLTNKIEIGDKGVVVGLCNQANVHKTSRLSLCVDFGAGNGRACYHASGGHIEHVFLFGGLQKGDRMKAGRHYPSIGVEAGDEGTVLGPCDCLKDDRSTADADKCVCVDFGFQQGKGVLHCCKAMHDCVVATHGASLRGFRQTQRFDDSRKYSNMLLKYNAYNTTHAHLQILQHAQLPGGFRKGDNVRAVVPFQCKQKCGEKLDAPEVIEILAGNLGTVVGPCGDQYERRRVCVDFGPTKGRVNIRACSTVIEHVGLTDRFQRGDRVGTLVADAQHSLSVGAEGRVVGLCQNRRDSAGFCVHTQLHSPRISVDFGHVCPSSGQSMHICMPLDQVQHARLVGGFQKGDRVNTLVEYTSRKGSTFNVGHEGTVVGPCNDEEDEHKDRRVCVDMGPGQGRVNCMACTQLSHVKLAGGFQKNDLVIFQDYVEELRGGGNDQATEVARKESGLGAIRDLLEQAPNLEIGDLGLVDGPCTDRSLHDADERVCVYFGRTKTILNYLISSVQFLQHAPLFAGYQKGDRVRATRDYTNTHVKMGYEGTILGPCTDKSLSDAHKRLSVSFDAMNTPGSGSEFRWKQDCSASLYNMELVPLVGNFRKGDRVRALLRCPPSNVQVGDEGTVLRASRQKPEEHLEVLFDFDKKRVVFAVWNLEHTELAGGFAKGDLVRSLIHTKPRLGDKHLRVGDMGVVAGEDGEKRVLVDFGANMRLGFDLPGKGFEHAPLLGGFRKHDRVRSLIQWTKTAGDKSLDVGDEGSVVGQEQENRLLVYFGAEIGRLAFELPAQVLEHIPHKCSSVDSLLEELECKEMEAQADSNATALLEEIEREEMAKSRKKERNKKKRESKKLLKDKRRNANDVEGPTAKAERQHAQDAEKAGSVAAMRGCAPGTQQAAEARAADPEGFRDDECCAPGTQQAAEARAADPEGFRDDECCICLTEKKQWLFVPCGHCCVCKSCAHAIMQTKKECPYCGQEAAQICVVFW